MVFLPYYVLAFLLIYTIGRIVQERVGLIASHIFYLLSGQLLINTFSDVSNFVLGDFFYYLIIITIGIIIANDMINISWKLIKQKAWSIFFLAIVNVLVTVSIMTYFENMLLVAVAPFSYFLLSTIVTPTDPAGVIAALGNFKVPKKLKYILETESLGNDVSAIILNNIAASLYIGAITLSFKSVGFIVFKQLGIVLIVSVFVGYIGLFLLKFTKDVYTEFGIMLLSILSASIIAEYYFHVSGILAVIIVSLIQGETLKKIWSQKDTRFAEDDFIHPQNHSVIKNILFTFADFSNAIIFISIGAMFNYLDSDSIVWTYMDESLIVFAIYTLTRASFMAFYSKVSKYIKGMHTIDNFRWWLVLTFGGMKGGISIFLFLVILRANPDMDYAEMFMAIIFNVVFLVTFVYTFSLQIIFKVFKKEFDEEYYAEYKK